jgi:hypothetical protein
MSYDSQPITLLPIAPATRIEDPLISPIKDYRMRASPVKALAGIKISHEGTDENRIIGESVDSHSLLVFAVESEVLITLVYPVNKYSTWILDKIFFQHAQTVCGDTTVGMC